MTQIAILVVDILSILITFPGYMFILVVNILDWWKNKRLDISDQLISGISILLLTHRFQYASMGFIRFTNMYHTIEHLPWIHLLYLTLIFCTLLFSTWLAVHFCLKIVTIDHNLYIYIQRMFPKMFPWILLPSVLASVIVCTPAAMTYTLSHNSTDAPQIFPFFPFYMFSSLCFFLLVSSALNILLSLHRHIRQMQNNTIDFRSQVVEAHVSAMKTIISLLGFNISYFLLLIILIVNLSYETRSGAFTFSYALCHILGVPILIQGSRKLKKTFKSVCLSIFIRKNSSRNLTE